jgi:hypothetical protein
VFDHTEAAIMKVIDPKSLSGNAANPNSGVQR